MLFNWSYSIALSALISFIVTPIIRAMLNHQLLPAVDACKVSPSISYNAAINTLATPQKLASLTCVGCNKRSVLLRKIVFIRRNALQLLRPTRAIEIRLNGKPLPNCSQDEMLNNLYHPHWFYYLISIFTFLFVLPLIFNFSFYPNLWNSFWEK